MKKNNLPKISVIVPCFNCEKYIANCLDSLLKQKYSNFEVIIINDGSTDLSEKIIRKYIKNDTRIKLINKKNEGVWQARITGIKNATGDYISFIDADDDVSVEFLSKLINSVVRNKSDIAICGYKRIDIKTRKVLAKEMINWKQENFCISDNLGILPSINTSNWNKIYKRSLFIDYEEIELKSKTFEDLALNIVAFINAKKISFVNDTLYNYYVNPNSIMNNLNGNDIESFEITLKNIRDFVEKRNTQYLEIIDLMAIIHLGFSIASRVYNSDVGNKRLMVISIRNYIKTNFPLWNHNKYASIRYQIKHKFINLKVTILYYAFKFNMINLLLKIYLFVIKTLKIDIKW